MTSREELPVVDQGALSFPEEGPEEVTDWDWDPEPANSVEMKTPDKNSEVEKDVPGDCAEKTAPSTPDNDVPEEVTDFPSDCGTEQANSAVSETDNGQTSRTLDWSAELLAQNSNLLDTEHLETYNNSSWEEVLADNEVVYNDTNESGITKASSLAVGKLLGAMKSSLPETEDSSQIESHESDAPERSNADTTLASDDSTMGIEIDRADSLAAQFDAVKANLETEHTETQANSDGVVVERAPPLKDDDEAPLDRKKEHDKAQLEFKTWSAKASRAMANNPCRWFWVTFILTTALSALGMVFGDFTVDADNVGWQSRGTLIANRHSQVLLVTLNQGGLSEPNNEGVWENLINNVQPGWEIDHDDRRRRLQESSRNTMGGRSHPVVASSFSRDLQLPTDSPYVRQCTVGWYEEVALVGYYDYLWPVWKIREGMSAIDPEAIRDLCKAEQNTVKYLEDNGLCFDHCGDGKCQPPFSIVLLARIKTWDLNFTKTCDELGESFALVRDSVEAELIKCVQDIKQTYVIGQDELPASCPLGFHPFFVDALFAEDSNDEVRYTSSAFSTIRNTELLYDHVGGYDRATSSNIIEGAYDTQWDAFNEILVDEALYSDMTLAIGSAVVTGLAILLHTRSIFITVIGLAQVILSFPLAFFCCKLILGLEFFPFLNFIGVFVVFAIGADDIFVAVDKWKNARIDHLDCTTQQVAAVAFPDAAHAMFLTTITTAIAFFGTAVCQVAPLKIFAIFSGCLIMFDYMLCILLVFPALCMYDIWLKRGNNCFVSCHCLQEARAEDGHRRTEIEFLSDEEKHPSLIHRILSKFYDLIHFCRFPLFVAIIAAFAVSATYTAKLELSASSDVRLLDSSHEFEQNYLWRRKLLGYSLIQDVGSQGNVIWGVLPADTGDHNNPDEFTQLVLDDSFDPSSEESQLYLINFCSYLLDQDFADPINEGFECPMEKFRQWLERQYVSATTTNETISTARSQEYLDNCGGASKLPLPQYMFHRCASSYARATYSSDFLQRDGEIEIIWFPFRSRIRFDYSYSALDSEWHLIENWMQNQTNVAPVGINNMFASSADFWWYDTNGSMLQTAIGASAIALAAAAAVMLISSRSFEITIMALFTIAFILVSVIALLVAIDWTLGFLESICIAILIGISCDFVLHFGHAYCTIPGNGSRHERTKIALINMGPSILAASFTTMAAAILMLFTVITFFTKFAQILLFTILMATAGAFIVFLTLTDIFGPSSPQAFVDRLVAKIGKIFGFQEDKVAPISSPPTNWEEDQWSIDLSASWDFEEVTC